MVVLNGASEHKMTPHERDRLTAVEVTLETLEKDVKSLTEAVTALNELLHQSRGAVRLIMILSSIAVGVGTLVATAKSIFH